MKYARCLGWFLLIGAGGCPLTVLMLLLACRPPLERPDVPLWAGLRLEQDCSDIRFERDLELFDTHGLSGWMIEVPFTLQEEGVRSGFKYYEAHALDTLIPHLSARHIPYGLHFVVENPRRIPLAHAHATHCFTDISGMLLRVREQGYPPDFLAFSGAFLDSSFSQGSFRPFLQQLLQAFPQHAPRLILAGTKEELARGQELLPLADVLGIVYREPPDLAYKPHFRALNARFSQLLAQLNKPAFIVQSNLVGNQKLLLLKNQLRFWEAGVQLRGLVLNSIYCEFSLADSNSHFGLAREGEIQGFIKTYSRP